MRDRRRIAWLIEKCPKSKPAEKRIWTVVRGMSYATRKDAMSKVNWENMASETHIYRCWMYFPV